MELSGRSAVVTGAGMGIGEAIARRLAGEGAAVTVGDIDEVAGADTVAQIAAAGGTAQFVRTDVGVPEDVAAMLEASSVHGPLAVLVNNAGIVSQDLFPNSDPATSLRILDVNFRGPLHGTHLAIRAMREHGGGGAIVNIASLAGVGLGPHPSPDYAATKAAIIRLTTALVSLAAEGIRVNCVCPDWVDTPMTDRTCEALGPELSRLILPPELTAADEIADAALALLTDDSLAGRVMCCYCASRSSRRLLPRDEGWG
jgi:NAD(P)-dependent dehydrogenase (short-subunit alcohol dehydrogenase family)